MSSEQTEVESRLAKIFLLETRMQTMDANAELLQVVHALVD